MGVIGLNAYTSGSFLPALVKSAHYSRAQVSFATLLLSVVVALVAPIVGLAVDRWGASRVIALAIIGEAFGFAVLASAPAEFALFAGATVFLAVLGAGTTPPGFSRIIATRFDKRRGLALGVMISGVGVTAVVAPLVVTPVVGAFGWRAGYLLLCGAVLVLGGSGLFLIGRDRPSPRTKASNSGTASGWRALRKPLYWLVIIGFATPALCGGGFLLHLITILRQRGFSPFQAAQVQALVGVSIIVGRLSTGFVMDRIFAGYVAGITFALSAIGTALLLSTNGAILCVAALAIGLTLGAELNILALMVSRYFGLPSFARLYGLAYSLMILAGGLSPFMIVQLSPDGDYSEAIEVCAVGLGASALIVAFLPRFKAQVLKP